MRGGRNPFLPKIPTNKCTRHDEVRNWGTSTNAKFHDEKLDEEHIYIISKNHPHCLLIAVGKIKIITLKWRNLSDISLIKAIKFNITVLCFLIRCTDKAQPHSCGILIRGSKHEATIPDRSQLREILQNNYLGLCKMLR